MRIAIFSDTFPPEINGVATATYALSETLRERGNKVIVITTALSGQKRLSYIGDVVRIPGITMKKLYNYKLASIYSHKVFDILRFFKPDVIHIQTEASIGIFGRIAAHNLKVPLVYTYHTMYEDYTYYVTGGFKPFDLLAKKAVALFSAFVGDSTTAFITTSHKTKEALRRYGVRKYINIIPNAIDLEPFRKTPEKATQSAALRKKLNLEGKYVLLIVGRLAKEKSDEIILRDLRYYLDVTDDRDIRLVIVGDGPDRSNLEKMTSDLCLKENVIFVGPVDHDSVNAFYLMADVYVSASVSETQGLTYIEAMASGCPMLARYDDNLSCILKDGITGFIFSDKRVFASKLSKIKKLTPEGLRKITDAAYKTASGLYGLDLYYERIMNVYIKATRKYW